MNQEALAIIQELIIQQRESVGFTAHEEEMLKEFIETVITI